MRERASIGLGRCLWYAMRYGSAWLDTPVPKEVASEIARFAPPAPNRIAMDRLLARTLPPATPESEPGTSLRLARFALFLRSVWLQMPPWLLAYHAIAKFVRGVLNRPRATDDG